MNRLNRLVGHSHALIIGILGLQPSGNLFRRPVQDQFTRNDLPQLLVPGKKAPLRSQRGFPGSAIRIMGPIGRTATMVDDLPAHGRRGSIEASGYATYQELAVAGKKGLSITFDSGLAGGCRIASSDD
jgi:hypothetical protein